MRSESSPQRGSSVLKIVQLTTDNREPFRQYDNPEPWFGTAPEALLQGFAALPEVEVHVIGCTQQPMASSPAKLAENIWFHSLHVPKWGWLRTGYQGCVRAIRRKVREIAPDIVHGQGTERECALGAVFSDFPNVVTIHGNMSSIIPYQSTALGRCYNRCAALLEALALRRTMGVFCNSAYTESLVTRHCQKVWRVPNAVRRAFLQRPTMAPVSTLPVLLNVGSINPRKRQVELLDLANKLHATGAGFLLNFIGGLDEHSQYGREFSARLAVGREAGYANFLGSLDGGQLIAAMDSASALIHVPHEEAFGLVVPEALARNLKVFATRTGGVVDIAEGVEGAELFSTEDWGALGDALAHWLQLGAPRPTTAATEMAARYEPTIIARRHLEIYREVLATAS